MALTTSFSGPRKASKAPFTTAAATVKSLLSCTYLMAASTRLSGSVSLPNFSVIYSIRCCVPLPNSIPAPVVIAPGRRSSRADAIVGAICGIEEPEVYAK